MSTWLMFRSLLWAILLPGTVAGYIPWRYLGLDSAHIEAGDPEDLVGVFFIGLGASVVAACVFEFAQKGRGTLSPVDPPRHLVVRGLYRYVRNPMYVGVTLILLGEALVARSVSLVIYWSIWFAAVNMFVIGYEEPALQRKFGASYTSYRYEIPRWIPRLRPTDGGTESR